MHWPREIIDRDHEIQNPLSPEKIRRLGEYLRLSTASRVPWRAIEAWLGPIPIVRRNPGTGTGR